MNPSYYLKCNCQKLVFGITVNDVLVEKEVNGEGLTSTFCINKWLFQKENQLVIFLQWPPKKSYQPSLGTFEFSLFLVDPTSDIPTPQEILHTWKWPVAPELEAYPKTYTHGFAAPLLPELQLASKAEVITQVSEDDKNQMLALIDQFSQAIKKKDVNTAFACMAFRYADEARAEGKPFARLEQAVKEQFEWLAGREKLKMDQATLPLFKIVLQSKAVWVRNPKEEPFLMFHEDNGTRSFGFDFYFSKVDGRWVIVR